MPGSITLTILVLGLLGLELESMAQEKAKPKALPNIPLYELEVSSEEPAASQLPSQVYEASFACTSDGSLAINSYLPPDKAKPRSIWVLYTISPNGKTTSFDFKKIDDLSLKDGQNAISHDFGERDVDFLFRTLPAKSAADAPTQDKPVAPLGWFVARFDREGAYHGATELNLPRLVPQRMAAFDNGDLLIFALDEVNRQPQLILYSTIGQKIHYYFTEAEFARKSPDTTVFVTKGTNPDKSRVELFQLAASMQISQLSHYKDSILLLQKEEGTPLFQAFPDGSVRTIKLPKVEDFSVDMLIPSDDHLYVQYRKPGIDPNGNDRLMILELDASTGDELRRIGSSDLEVACVHQGVFRVIKHSGEHAFQFFNANLRAAVQ